MTLELPTSGRQSLPGDIGRAARGSLAPIPPAAPASVACWRCGSRFTGVLHIVETPSGPELHCLTCGAVDETAL
jgi:hypothetical protein